MNIFKRILIRTYQLILKVAIKFINFPKPLVLNNLTDTIGYLKNQKVLIIVPTFVSKNEVFIEYIKHLDRDNITYQVALNDISNPTVSLVEDYCKNYNPTIIVTIGGGSVIDLGKLIIIKMANQNKPLKKMRGILKVKKKIISQIAVPTTSGSGSEATVAAVVIDDNTHEKYSISDPKNVPEYAVLDARLTSTMPSYLTAITGMDALTHAIECYIGRANTKETIKDSEYAIKLILENLIVAYDNGLDLTARKNMQMAAYYAGCAFTKGYVGYVHALAHQLGGLYNVDHGLANAVLLPVVLEEYGNSINKSLKELTKSTGIENLDLINKIFEMNQTLNIGKCIPELKEEDIPLIIKRAKKEAHPLYPVPKLFNDDNFKNILMKILIR